MYSKKKYSHPEETKLRKEFENLIYIMIDQKQIYKKIKLPLNKSNENYKYYIISCDWLKEYLKIYNLNELYNNQIINTTLESIVNSSQNNTLNETIFNNAILKPECKNIINQIKGNNLVNDYLNNISTTPSKININKISFYCDFILISEETKKKIFNTSTDLLFFRTNFGDNKIFAITNAPSEYIINVYNLENNNFIPEIFYYFRDVNGLSNSLKILNEKGYLNFTNCYIIFNDSINQKDYASPIFNDNNKEIGYAYRYSPNFNDYSPFIINNEYKNMLKLYYYYISLRSITLSQTKKFYYLVNSEYMNKFKEHYDFSIFNKDYQKNNMFTVIGKNIKENPTKFKDILNDKAITLIIKSFPLYINQNFNLKGKAKLNDIQDIPKIIIDQNKIIYFYDEFELIDNEIYFLLFKNHNNNGIARECNFIDGYIYFKLPGNLNMANKSYIIEFGSLNDNNVFKAKYLLEFNSENAFSYCLKLSNQLGGFSTYVNSIRFRNNIEQLYDIDTNNPIGLIYNLDFKQSSPGSIRRSYPPNKVLEQSTKPQNLNQEFKPNPNFSNINNSINFSLNNENNFQSSNILENKCNEELSKNKKLEEENQKLRQKLNKIIQNNIDEINKLKDELNQIRKENDKLKNDLFKANKIIANFKNDKIPKIINNDENKNLLDEILNLKNQLNTKETEINDLKEKLKNNDIFEPKFKMNDIMVLNFLSPDHIIHCGIKCLATDIFADVEKKLYKLYDEYKNTNNLCTAHAMPVLRFKTIRENNIKDGDVIQIIKME